ncbi:unnamed protein product, partial [Amoebophrya sp. A25]
RIRPRVYQKKFDFYLVGGLVRPVEMIHRRFPIWIDHVLPQIIGRKTEDGSVDLGIFYDLAESSTTSLTSLTTRTSDDLFARTSKAASDELSPTCDWSKGYSGTEKSSRKLEVHVSVNGVALPQQRSPGTVNKVAIPVVNLWSVDEPALLDVAVDLVGRCSHLSSSKEDSRGEEQVLLLDQWREKIGVRILETAPGQVIHQNGKHLQLKGVNRHDNFFLALDAGTLLEGLFYVRDLFKMLHLAEEYLQESSGGGGSRSVVENVGKAKPMRNSALVEKIMTATSRGEKAVRGMQHTASASAPDVSPQQSTEKSLFHNYIDVTLHGSPKIAENSLHLLEKLGLLDPVLNCVSALSDMVDKDEKRGEQRGSTDTKGLPKDSKLPSEKANAWASTLFVSEDTRCTTAVESNKIEKAGINPELRDAENEAPHSLVRHFLSNLRDVLLLKDLNSNFVRGAHYTQSDLFLSLCDVFGVLVWEETLSWQAKREDVADGRFRDAQLQAMASTVVAHRLHPSVAVWGFLNEVDAREDGDGAAEDDTEQQQAMAAQLGNEEASQTRTPTGSVSSESFGSPRRPSIYAEGRGTNSDTDRGTFRDPLMLRSLLPRSSFTFGQAFLESDRNDPGVDGKQPLTTASQGARQRESSQKFLRSNSVNPSFRAVKSLFEELLLVIDHFDPPLSFLGKSRRNRFRTFASRYKERDSQQIYDLVDLIVFNDYPGWYDLSTDLPETVSSFRRLSLMGHNIQGR